MRLRFWKSKAPRDPDEPKSVRWKRRGKNAAIWLAVLTVVYTLFGFFIVPLIVKHVGAPQASKRINGTIEMRKASFNPWTLAFGADGVRVLDDTGEEVLAFEKFRGDFQLIDTVFNSGFHFGKGELTAPQATLVRRPDGVINLLTIPIIPEEKTSEPIKKLPRLVIADLFVVDGGAVIKDEALTSPFEKRIADLDFEIERLDTRPTHQNDHTLSLSLGESAGITWNGATYADPLSATGRIEVTGLDIATFMPYAEGYADAEIASGTLDAVVLYDMAPAASPRRAMVTVESATVTDLSVVHGEHPILLVGAAGVDNAVADADDQNFSVANVRVDSPRVSIRRDETGAIELVDIATGVELGGAGAAPGASGSTATESAEVDLAEAPIEALRLALLKLFEDALGPWDLDVEALTIENGRIDVEDLGAPQPVSVSLTALGLQAGPVSSSEDFRVPFSLSVDVAGDNTLTCEGLLEPMSPALQASVATDGIDASWIAPYLPSELPEPLPPAKLDSLAVRLDGRATAKLDGDTATLDWNGLAELVDLAVTNADDGAPIFGGGALGADVQLNATADADGLGSATVTGSAHAEALRVELDLATPVLAAVGAASVTGIDIKLAGNSLEGASLVVAEALVEDPVLEASAPLLMPAEEPSEAESEDAPTIDLANPLAELPIELRIDTVGVRNGTLTLRNLDPEQPVELFIDEATVDLTGIATGGETIAVVDVDSRVNQSGRATVAGGFDLFRPKPYVNLTLQTQAVAIEPYEPFVGRYLGYEVESGRATITLPITIENWQVDGQLDARLNSFHLGDETGSPEAPDLPIPLGLDLLRDRNDLIRLDVPFEATIEDQSFSVGRVIRRAILNTLGNVATAPFALIGQMFGAGEDADLSRVVFEPGISEFDPAQIPNLDALASFLTERPAVALTVTGHADRAADTPAMRRIILDQTILDRVRESRASATSVDDETNRAIVAQLFARAFPDRRGTRIPPPLGAREQPALSHGLMERALLEAIPVTDEMLLELAGARAEAAVLQLVTVSPELQDRIRLAEPVIDHEDPAPRAAFELKTN